jgi:pyruvate,water dikinase
MGISNQEQVSRMTLDFFKGDYDFLKQAEGQALSGFYTPIGHWSRIVEKDRTFILQDGSRAGFGLSAGVARMMGKVVGVKYQQFLDTTQAYFYFPIAIAKESSVSDATIETSARPVSGSIDRAGGLVFGLRNVGNYFVLRVNTLEDNFILFEFVNNRRFQRVSVDTETDKESFVNPFHKLDYKDTAAREEAGTEKWYRIKVEISGKNVKGYLNDNLLIEYTSQSPIEGYVGLWTKADSVTHFGGITVQTSSWEKTLLS